MTGIGRYTVDCCNLCQVQIRFWILATLPRSFRLLDFLLGFLSVVVSRMQLSRFSCQLHCFPKAGFQKIKVRFYQYFVEYLKTNDCNVFFVDWSPLNQSPCYPGAVWNARHVGVCTAQLVDRIKDMGATNIHVIGFSLGYHTVCV